jgi:hypothetical protein
MSDKQPICYKANKTVLPGQYLNMNDFEAVGCSTKPGPTASTGFQPVPTASTGFQITKAKAPKKPPAPGKTTCYAGGCDKGNK